MMYILSRVPAVWNSIIYFIIKTCFDINISVMDDVNENGIRIGLGGGWG